MRYMLNQSMFLQPGLEPVMILVVVVVFLLFGSKKIPDLARSFGKARGEFKKGQEETDAELKKPSEREKLEQAAESFGIDTEGKSDDELRDAIKKATDKK